MNVEQFIIIAFTALLSFLSGRAQNIASRHDKETAKKQEQFQHIVPTPKS